MREVLRLEFDAAADAILVTVAATKQSEHVPGTFVRQLGVPELTASIPVASLPKAQAAAFRALLVNLIPLTETKVADDVADPAALAKKAADVARMQQSLAAETQAAQEAKAALDVLLEERRAEAARLDAAIAVKRASVEAQTATKE
jgi:hypothetical protein